jgi:hypothetical protein
MTEESTSPPSGQADRPEKRSRFPRLPWAVRNAGWRVQERVLWPAWDAVRSVPGEATWPVRRAGWTVQRRAIWPAQDQLAERSPAVRGGVAGVLIALSAGALVGGALIGTSGGGTASPAPAPAPRLAADTRAQGPVSVSLASAAANKPSKQVLEGVPPNLRSTIEGDAADSGAAGDSSASSTAPANPEASKAPRPPNVPKALAVANRFANAFVLYEVGNTDPTVHKTFADTAAKPLARALTKRPPRQPDGVKVPKAKVLNVVPGPLHGTNLSVSVALLRLGATSELRLQLQNDRQAGWQVSDVRG